MSINSIIAQIEFRTAGGGGRGRERLREKERLREEGGGLEVSRAVSPEVVKY